MTSTRDRQAPRAAAVDQPDPDDTTGFDVVNTTRSNIPIRAADQVSGVFAGLVPPLGALRPLPLVGGAGIALPEVGSQFGIKENGVR